MIEEETPPYWCPDCKERVWGTAHGDRNYIKIVCTKCGSEAIEGYSEEKKFNPSRR